MSRSVEETTASYREMGAVELLEAIRARGHVLFMGMTCAEKASSRLMDEAHSSSISQKVRRPRRSGVAQVPGGGREVDRVLRGARARQGHGGGARDLRIRRARRQRRAPRADRDRQDLPYVRARQGGLRQEDQDLLHKAARPRGPSGARPRTAGGDERKLLRKYGAFGLLVIDEWLSRGRASCSGGCCWSFSSCATGGHRPSCARSSPKKDWHPRPGGGVHGARSWTALSTTPSGSR